VEVHYLILEEEKTGGVGAFNVEFRLLRPAARAGT
jgi:hypothetical protein